MKANIGHILRTTFLKLKAKTNLPSNTETMLLLSNNKSSGNWVSISFKLFSPNFNVMLLKSVRFREKLFNYRSGILI